MDNVLDTRDLMELTDIALPLIDISDLSGERAHHNEGRQFFDKAHCAQ